MSAKEYQQNLSEKDILELMDMIETTLIARGIDDLSERIVSGIARITQSSSALIYIFNSQISGSHFLQHGFQSETIPVMKKICKERFDVILSRTDLQSITVPLPSEWNMDYDLILYPLRTGETCLGMIGLTSDMETASSALLEKILHLFAITIHRFSERMKIERQLSHLNQYLTVSSMLAKSFSLHELLEITLQCCMEAVSAEGASILILDDEKKSFYFYTAEGPAKPVLMTSTFPVDKGLAGSVFQSQQSEIINDVSRDSRFYTEIDSKSNFHTRDMIVIPLTAGEEKIGVLEVLNKENENLFTEEEHMLLLMIAEEIAFAIRNAKVFEYVVNSYCKQRQGQAACKGCKRPLGSWTPCAKYREPDI